MLGSKIVTFGPKSGAAARLDALVAELATPAVPTRDRAVSTDTAKIRNWRVGPIRIGALGLVSRFFGRAEDRDNDMPCDLPFDGDNLNEFHHWPAVLVSDFRKGGRGWWCAVGALPLRRTIADPFVGARPETFDSCGHVAPWCGCVIRKRRRIARWVTVGREWRAEIVRRITMSSDLRPESDYVW